MSARSTLARLLLPRYASGSLPRVLADFVRAALDADPALAATYTALRRAERAAASGAHTSAAQRDVMEAALFGAMTSSPVPASARFGFARAVAPLAAACASVAVFAFLPTSTSTSNSTSMSDTHAVGELAARSAALAQHPLGVRVTCVSGERVVDTATAGARRHADRLTCPASSLLAFSLTNLSPTERYVFVVGVAPDGGTRWYAPFERSAAAMRATPGHEDEVLPVLGDMRGMPDDDHVTLHVLVSDVPFHGSDIERQLSAARTRGVPLGSVDKLPLPDIPLQARVDMARAQRDGNRIDRPPP